MECREGCVARVEDNTHGGGIAAKGSGDYNITGGEIRWSGRVD